VPPTVIRFKLTFTGDAILEDPDSAQSK